MLIFTVMGVAVANEATKRDHGAIKVARPSMQVNRTLQCLNDLTRFNKIATQGAPQMAVDKEANSLSRVYSYYSKFNLCLFYV